MNRKLEIAGILLILVAILCFTGWELWGKNYFETTEVIVSLVEIPKGSELDPSLFTTLSVEKKAVSDGAVTPDTINRIKGKCAEVTIPANSQITASFLRDDSDVIGETESIYTLKGEWITLRSSSLRRGDYIDVYSMNSKGGAPDFLGEYRVAFVKDANDVEISDPSDAKTSDFFTPDILSRTSSNSIIYKVEIIATLEEYMTIVNAVLNTEPSALDTAATSKGNDKATLMLVQVTGMEKENHE